MQTKPLTVDTQRVVDELRALKAAVELLHGPQGNTAILGRAISRLSYLDVDREQLTVWLQEERTKIARLEAAQAAIPTTGVLADPHPLLPVVARRVARKAKQS